MKLDDQTEIELVHITIAPNRRKVLEAFNKKEILRPYEVRDITGIEEHISNHLKWHKEHGYVVLLNPEVTKPRYYQLTSEGKRILELLNGLANFE